VADLDGQKWEVLEAAQASERGAQLLLPTLLERLGFRVAQALDEALDDFPVLAGPKLGDVGQELGILLDGSIGDVELPVARSKRNADPTFAEVLESDLNPLHHGIESCQPLLAIDDEFRRGVLLAIDADQLRVHVRGVPKHQVADGEASIHRVEQITHGSLLPNEGALKLG